MIGSKVRLLLAQCALAASLPLQAGSGSVAASSPLLQVADIHRLADVAEPAFSPDGEQLVYSVSVDEVDADLSQSDLWRVGYDGRRPQQLTFSRDSSEWLPQWSPDGRQIAFLSDRGEDGSSQIWLLAADGGEPRQLSTVAAGVEDFVWSPDARRMVLVARDPERPADAVEPPNPPPIVSTRYQFKEDITGFLDHRRQHLYLLDLATGAVERLTGGDYDDYLPSWSPDGRQIAFVSKRSDEPDRNLNYDIHLVEARAGAPVRRLTRFAGADLDPYWESRPAWSPDGRRIAYLQGGKDRWIYYAPWQLAVIDVASGESRLPAPIDRCMLQPRWSRDGRSVYVLVEENRVTHLERIELDSGRRTPLTRGARFDYGFAVSTQDRLVVLGGDDAMPYELHAVEARGLRPLSRHNAWLRDKALAQVEPIGFRSADGTPIDGFLLRPAGYREGQRYPTVLRLHGGPVYQFSHEFMFDWQVYAAHGFAVLAVNPRGSSGRGFDFARAIHADWGNKDVQDALAAVDHAVKLGVADPDRLGVGGWSYGSILSNYVIASDTRFKAAVSGAGASNLFGMYGHDQYAAIYELELGTPWQQPELYARLSYPFLHADRIRTPTLFLCAQQDFNVPCLGAEQMYQALSSLRLPTMLVQYPGENHGLSVPSYRRDRLQRSLDWYRRYLGAATP